MSMSPSADRGARRGAFLCSRRAERREEAITACDLKGTVKLRGRPRCQLVGRPTALFGFGIGCDVAHHESPLAGVAQCLVQDDVDLEHRLRFETALAVASTAGKQLGVERLEVMRAKPSKR